MKKAAILSAIAAFLVAGCHPNYVEETVSPKTTVKATKSNAIVPQSTASPVTSAPGLSQPSGGGDIGDSAGSVGQAAKDRAKGIANSPNNSTATQNTTGE